jgi:hypothetical protein
MYSDKIIARPPETTYVRQRLKGPLHGKMTAKSTGFAQ